MALAHRLIRVDSQVFFMLPPAIQAMARKHSSVFVSDWSWMSGLDVRKGYEHYGATAFFSEKAELLAMFWPQGNKTVLPGLFHRNIPSHTPKVKKTGFMSNGPIARPL